MCAGSSGRRGTPVTAVLAALCCGAVALASACTDEVPGPATAVDSGYGNGAADGQSPWANREGGPGFDTGPAVEDDGGATPDPSMFNCPDVPTAYVLEYTDPYTGVEGEAPALLAAAGFDVQPLPLDRDPRELRGLILLGSFVSESQAYRDWIARYPTQIYTFGDAANALVQLTQADQTELRPPFLPNSQSAVRTDLDVGQLVALDPQHPLLAGVPIDASGNLVWQGAPVGWETFGMQNGFAVLLAAGRNAESPTLMEGAYAQGRFILAAMALDKPNTVPGPDRDAFNRAF